MAVEHDTATEKDNTQNYFYGGIRWDTTDKLSLLFKAGLQHKEFDEETPDFEDSDNFVVDLQTLYRITEKTDVVLDLYRTNEESDSTAASERVVLGALLGYTQKFTEKITGKCRFTYYDNEDLTTKVRVSTAGTIVVPLLGQIEVKGGTVNGIIDKITRSLADGYLVNPQVNIFVEEYRSKKVVVLGNVRTPGLIELSGPTNFLELVSKAGGLEKDAGDTATIQRKNGAAAPTVIVIGLLALIEMGDLSQNVQITDGDTVFISKAGMCFITGEVKSPGTYSCGDGTTVLRLVALAGGFTGKASKSSISVVRIVNNEKKVYKDVDLYTALQDNDVVVVPESFF
jgi:polysaccharide export outer membrane protein